MLSPTSMAAIFSTLDPSSVAFIISLSLRNDFWKGREDKVFEQLGPEIKDEALQMLEVEDLMRIFKHSASEDLGSRVSRVVVDKNKKLEETTSMLENQLKQRWDMLHVAEIKIRSLQIENKELKKMDTEKYQQIRDLEITCHQLKKTETKNIQGIQDLQECLEWFRSMDKAKHQQIKDLERHIAHLESTRGPLDSSSESCPALNSTTDRECLEPKMEEMPISNVFLTHELPAQGAAALPKRKD